MKTIFSPVNYVGSNNGRGDVCHVQGQYMEGRHCLSAASVISGLAGEVPSEEAAKESEYLSKIHSSLNLSLLFL